MNWPDFAFGVAWPLGWAAWLVRRHSRPRAKALAARWIRQSACCAIGWIVGALIPGFAFFWFDVAGAAASLACAVALWLWLRRKNRGKAGSIIGAKSRARLAAIVRKARESAKPSPVMKPSLRGAS